MPESQERSPGENYFNDLSQQSQTPPSASKTNGEQAADPGQQQPQQPQSQSSPNENGGATSNGPAGVTSNGQMPKPKRVACVVCRKRKLKCDGTRPTCGTCDRLAHECSYDDVRRKSGPKRGYVKQLEARLAQVETLLRTQDDDGTSKKNSNTPPKASAAPNGAAMPDYAVDVAIGNGNVNMLSHLQQTRTKHDFPPQAAHPHSLLGTVNGAAAEGMADLTTEEPFPWEMIGLGLDEPLPAQDTINELNRAFFEKVHPSCPMIHRPRYFAAMNLAPHMRPPVCLRYAMWCLAASVTDRFEALQEHFYLRARKYAQQDEMKGHGEAMITIAHCQTWVLLATYEFKLMYFPRAWLSAGRACRLAQMMGLHRMDGNGLDVKQCLPPPKDWTEREERRRTFWMSFCVDRYSSIGTGWPMTIEEGDIMSSLPSTEEAFELSRPGKTMDLADALRPDGPPSLSSFAGVVLMACLFGRNLTHLHRPSAEDRDGDLNGIFWKRHREMDNILLNTSLALPNELRLPTGMNNPNTVFMNMNIHTSTICLHQAAIFKADKNNMPARVSAESKVRCITAAAEIASIMRQVSHIDLSGMNPFISFCLYVAARVFVQYLKSRSSDQQVRSSLQFLLQAMHIIKRKNPLTESFLVQLELDLEGAGLEKSISVHAQSPKTDVTNRSGGCPTMGHDGTGTDHFVTYGDVGVALYNQPNVTPDATARSANSESLGYGADISDPSSIGGVGAMQQASLPTRQHTSDSTPGSSIYKSPNTFTEMDTSPDGSGGTSEQQTPGSSAQLNISSSHTSTSAYSPQQELRKSSAPQDTAENYVAMFDPADDGKYHNDIVMSAYPASSAVNAVAEPQSDYVLPQTWTGAAEPISSAGGTQSLLPMSPMDLVGMSDADWSQVLNSMGGWETGLSDDNTPHQVSWGRRV